MAATDLGGVLGIRTNCARDVVPDELAPCVTLFEWLRCWLGSHDWRQQRVVSTTHTARKCQRCNRIRADRIKTWLD